MMTIRPNTPIERPIASRNLHRRRGGREYRNIVGAVSLMATCTVGEVVYRHCSGTLWHVGDQAHIVEVGTGD